MDTYTAMKRGALMAAISGRGIKSPAPSGNWTPYTNPELRQILREHDANPYNYVPFKPGSADEAMTDRQRAYLERCLHDARLGPMLVDMLAADYGDKLWIDLTKLEASTVIGVLKKAEKGETPNPNPTPTPSTNGDSPTMPTETTPAPAPAPEALTQLTQALSALGIGGQDPRVDKLAADVAALTELVAEDRRPVVKIHLPEKAKEVTLPDVHHPVLPRVIKMLRAGLNVMLVGPAGTGKSTIAYQAATALEIPFHAISVGPATPTSKLWGFIDGHGNLHRSELREAYEHGGVFLLDEIDNGHPGINTELNQATSNGHAAFPDGMVNRHPDCRFVATANTYGRGADAQYVGRNAQDAALLDRFVKVHVDYDRKLEKALAEAHADAQGVDKKMATDWLESCWKWRRKAEDERLHVIIGTRAVLQGIALFACDLTRVEVIDATFGSALKPAERTRLGI